MAKLVVGAMESDEDGIFWCVLCERPAHECYCKGCGCPTDREIEAAEKG
jgi:hypothetical protein